MTTFYYWDNDKLILNIRVQPQSSNDKFGEVINDRIKLRITAPPIDGKANSHLISFIARYFKTRKSDIEVVSGASSKNKRLEITRPKQIPDFN